MIINVEKKYVTDNLGINIDLSQTTDNNIISGYTIYSNINYPNSKRIDITLPDYGLCGYDFGDTTTMLEGTMLNANDLFKMKRISHNDEFGFNHIEDYEITLQTGNTYGNYFDLNGGYFSGYFKLEGYDYEFMPSRYPNGITIETLIKVNSNTEGIFYYMGTRSEDKYLPFFEGEVVVTGQTEINYVYGDNLVNEYSGYTTSNGNYLTSSTNKEIILSSFAEPEYSRYNYNDLNITNFDNINNNLIAFELTSDRRIGCSYVDENRLISQYSSRTLDNNGWYLIDIVYKPYIELVSDCQPTRYGSLNVFVNGILFWTISDFKEFYFRGLLNDNEKQIGVPYTISWGGGSFGLKNSYHFSGDTNTIVKDDVKNNLFIETYFNKPFIGGIQKLRIYNAPLTNNEIKQNLFYEQTKNSTLQTIHGGRIIFNPFSKTICSTIPSINNNNVFSGADIKRTVKFRNSDGTYRSLIDMFEIKIIVKSRSNPTEELIKFLKSSGDTEWIQLTYVDDYTYEFIVPDEITILHPNEVLFAEMLFQWYDSNDLDNLMDKIFVVDITPPLTDSNING